MTQNLEALRSFGVSIMFYHRLARFLCDTLKDMLTKPKSENRFNILTFKIQHFLKWVRHLQLLHSRF
jgi:hypothetical protein